MKLASDMKNLSQGILDSFRQRVKETEERVKDNVEFINEVQKTLDGFHKDHQEMAALINANAAALRKNLAQGEKERLNTFNGLMSGIHSTISTIQKEVVAIQSSTFNLLNEFTASRVQMAVELEKFFAQGRSDRAENEKGRMEGFDALMKNINADLKGINDEVLSIFKNTNDLPEKFEKEHQEMSAELRSELSKNLTERVNYTKSLLSGFQARLLEIGEENQQLAKEMRNSLAISQKNLSSGDVERIENYKAVMAKTHDTIKEIRKEVKANLETTSAMITDFSTDRDQAAAEWNKMLETIARIRENGIDTLKKVEERVEEVIEKKVETEVKLVERTEEAPVVAPEIEKTIETLVEAQPVAKIQETPIKTEAIVPMSLEDKIVDYINKHPKGVRISEMEKPLGETRMKLGYIAKELIESEKVRKIDNLYYPKE